MNHTPLLLCTLAASFLCGCEAIEDFQAVRDQSTDPQDYCLADDEEAEGDVHASIDGGLLDSIPPLPEVIGDDEATTPIVAGDVHLIGWTTHEGLLAIRSVAVGGVEAETAPDSFNFRRWTVTVPFSVLRALRGPDDLSEVPIVAFDACEPGGAAVGSFTVQPVLDAEAVVTELAATLQLPDGTDYLPTQAGGQATLTIQANHEAVGSQVALELPPGVSSDAPSGTITLREEGGEAQARVILSATAEAPDADRLVVVTSQARVASVALLTSGVPRWQVSATTLSPGQSASLLATSFGALEGGGSPIEACFATSTAQDVTVSNGSESLVGAIVDVEGALTVDADGVRVQVAVGAAATTGAVEVTCTDTFGQSGTAVLSVTASAP